MEGDLLVLREDQPSSCHSRDRNTRRTNRSRETVFGTCDPVRPPLSWCRVWGLAGEGWRGRVSDTSRVPTCPDSKAVWSTVRCARGTGWESAFGSSSGRLLNDTRVDTGCSRVSPDPPLDSRPQGHRKPYKFCQTRVGGTLPDVSGAGCQGPTDPRSSGRKEGTKAGRKEEEGRRGGRT